VTRPASACRARRGQASVPALPYGSGPRLTKPSRTRHVPGHSAHLAMRSADQPSDDRPSQTQPCPTAPSLSAHLDLRGHARPDLTASRQAWYCRASVPTLPRRAVAYQTLPRLALPDRSPPVRTWPSPSACLDSPHPDQPFPAECNHAWVLTLRSLAGPDQDGPHANPPSPSARLALRSLTGPLQTTPGLAEPDLLPGHAIVLALRYRAGTRPA
jgi:hypothetical protein